MRTINIPDELYDKLLDLANEMTTQNERSTAKPYFYQVMETKKEFILSPGYGEDAWFDGESILSMQDLEDRWNDEKPENEPFDYYKLMEENDNIIEGSVTERKELSNCFLTEKSIKQHIQNNMYHYENPVDYLNHAFRNPDLELVWEFIQFINQNKLEKVA